MYKVTLTKEIYMKMEFAFKHWADATSFMCYVMDNKVGEIDIKLEKITNETEGEEKCSLEN